MSLILKSATSNRCDGHWSDDDYDVTLDGRTIGRIFNNWTHSPGIAPWFWGLDWFSYKGKGEQYGQAASREAAMTAFREAWDRQ